MSERAGRDVVKQAALIAAAATAVVGFGAAEAGAAAPSGDAPGAMVESHVLDVRDVSPAAEDDTALSRVLNRVITQSAAPVDRDGHDFAPQGAHDSAVPIP